MKKRVLAMLLALVMCLALLPAAAVAETQTHYVLDKNGKEILRCTNYQAILQDGPDSLLSFEQNGKWGYIDQNGTVVIPARLDYDFAEAFSDGLARVTKNGKSGYIDRTGKEVIALKYGDACPFENGRAVVKLGEWKGEGEECWFDGKTGLIDKTGKVVIPFQYDEIYTYGEGMDRFGVALDNGHGIRNTIGLADADGKLLIEPGTFSWLMTYEGIDLFVTSVDTEQGRRQGVVDKNGKEVVPAVYDSIKLVRNEGSCAIITEQKDGNRYYNGLFDASGKQLLPVKYDIRHLVNTNLLKVIDGQYPDETIAIMDFSGRMVADFGKYSHMIDFAAGIGELIPVAKNGAQGARDRKWGALDQTGKEVIPCTLDIDVAYDGGDGMLSVVKDQTHRGLVDQTGTMIVPMEYGAAAAYENVIVIYRDEKYGLLDRSGKKTILPMEYDHLSVHGDVILAKKGGKYGALDTAGKVIVPIAYDEAYMISDELGLIGVRTGEWGDSALYGVYDAQGAEILPVEYNYLQFLNESWFTGTKGTRPDAPVTPDKPAVPATATAIPTNDKLTVNGKEVTPAAYKINNANYFMIRDLAALLDGTKSQFAVDWDDATQSATITTGQAYELRGTELQGKPTASATANLTNDVIYINGEKADLTIYKINNSNYIKLHDLGKLLDFYMSYDGATKTASIDTTKPYTE